MKELITISALGVIALFAEMFYFKRALFPIVLLGLALLVGFAYFDLGSNETLYGMMRMDNFALGFTMVMGVSGLIWFSLAQTYLKEETSFTDHVALILFAMTGGLVMVSYTNLVLLFIGIEILSISLYVLAGSQKTDFGSNEAAFKYFLMGAFASGFLLFGIALVYGMTGSFDLYDIANVINTNAVKSLSVLYAGILLMIVGLGFKASMAPFHFWGPDVYQGSPTPVTAFMATIVKSVAVAAFLRLFMVSFVETKASWEGILLGMAVLTLLIGNVTAVLQTSVKRMLAFSSVSHAGYLLLAIIALNDQSAKAILYYAAAYSVASLAAFFVVHILQTNGKSDDIHAFNGLSKSNPTLAFIMTVALLSLAGIPPLSGFLAKYFIFSAALSAGYLWMVLIAVFASLIGVYYYFRIIIAMYWGESVGSKMSVQPLHQIVLMLTCIVILFIGLLPQLITGFIN
ncbi:MAG: NADH-quinone oxidoreductase subunit N [Saprospiraceae bacterium]